MSSPLRRSRRLRRRVPIPAIAGIVVGVLLGAVVPAQIAQATSGTIASDTFSRTVKSGWGKAVKGGSWTTSVNSGASASVASGTAAIRNQAKSTSAKATLKSLSSVDTEVTATVGLPSGAVTLYSAFQLRYHNTTTSTYRGRIELTPSRKLFIAFSRKLRGGDDVYLGRVQLPGTWQNRAKVKVEFQVTGTSPVALAGRAWLSGTATPDWQIQLEDASSSRITSGGAVGIWTYAGKSNRDDIASTYDNLVVTRNPTPAADEQAATATPAPATTPPTESGEAAALGRGSAPVGTTRYAIPAGSLFVSPDGSDSAPGTEASPLRTVSKAVSVATSGTTIVLRKGEYNESVYIPLSKSLTVQSYPGEAVWFDGSVPVTTWTRSAGGSTWSTPWSYFPSSVMDGVADNPRFVDPTDPYASRPDQLFVDGTPLTQVGSASAVTTGTFYPDPSSGRVILGTDPSGRSVRISNQDQAFHVLGRGVVLQGFGVRRYATTYIDRSAIRLSNTLATARNLVLEDNAMNGINAENNDITLSNLTVERNGLVGVGINAAYGLRFTDSIVDDNNAQHFKTAPVAGGVKITRSRGILVQNLQANGNDGSGIWLDESVYDAKVIGNEASSNTVDGILVEISDTVVVADNVLNDNRSGAVIYNSADVQVLNNDIGGNSLFGVKLAQDERRQANTANPGHDPRQPLPDPTLTWIVKDITIANNAFGSGGAFQIYGLDTKTGISMDKMDVTITGNLFTPRVTGAQATLVGWGQDDNRTVVRYDSVQALAAAKGPTWKNAVTTSVLPVTAMTAEAKSNADIAVPLTSVIAGLIGQTAGTRRIGSF